MYHGYIYSKFPIVGGTIKHTLKENVDFNKNNDQNEVSRTFKELNNILKENGLEYVITHESLDHINVTIYKNINENRDCDKKPFYYTHSRIYLDKNITYPK